MAYSTRALLNSQFGKVNVDTWADIDNDGNATTIADRITWALNEATSELEDRLRFGPYTVPFTTVPNTIARMTSVLAANLLYQSRGFVDENHGANVLKRQMDWVEKSIRDVMTRRMRLNLTEASASFPQVIDDSDE